MFEQLVGNDHVKRLLIRTRSSRSRLPGALLFTGEEGCWKKLFNGASASVELNFQARKTIKAMVNVAHANVPQP